jgi:hypothetical protein
MALPNGAGGYQVGDGNLTEALLGVQAAPTALSADVTVTAAQLANGLFTVDSAADITATLPTVALLEATVSSAKVNSSFDFAVVNVDASYQVTFAVGTGWTIVGSAIVLEATSGQFRARKTSDTTWTLYRIA